MLRNGADDFGVADKKAENKNISQRFGGVPVNLPSHSGMPAAHPFQ
jgi:hypothetical protein